MFAPTLRQWICFGLLAILVNGCASLQPDTRPSAAACERFNFVVIGDTGADTSVFRRNIADINRLDPDFVIDIGDLIKGGESDPARINAMWDEFDEVIKDVQVPFIMVPGNHDIYSRVSEKIYYQRYGQTYFSFNYRNAHFIVLNSEALNDQGAAMEEIRGDQLEWLRADLAAHPEAALTFVFMHRPLWTGATAAAWMASVHPLLARHRVAAVFAGHAHRYAKFPAVDGVQYYISGGGGSPTGTNEAAGEFHHFCFVSATPPHWKVAVIKTGSILPDTIVQAER